MKKKNKLFQDEAATILTDIDNLFYVFELFSLIDITNIFFREQYI